MLQQELPDRPGDSVLVVRWCDMKRLALHFVGCVAHRDPEAGQAEHPDVGLRITHRYRLVRRDTELLQHHPEGMRLLSVWVRQYHVVGAVGRPVDREASAAAVHRTEPARDLADRFVAQRE